MYKICLIDEEKSFESTLDWYLSDISEQNWDEIELIYIDPSELDITSLIDTILDKEIDLILIDYKLAISYDWEDIISQINYKNPFLPKAILTSNPEEFSHKYIDFRALDKKYVNIDSGEELYHLMLKSISEYREKKNELQKEFDDLYEKVSSNEATNKQINRFMEIDEKITKTFGLDSSLNKWILDKTYLWELQEIIDLAKEIIKK